MRGGGVPKRKENVCFVSNMENVEVVLMKFRGILLEFLRIQRENWIQFMTSKAEIEK